MHLSITKILRVVMKFIVGEIIFKYINLITLLDIFVLKNATTPNYEE